MVDIVIYLWYKWLTKTIIGLVYEKILTGKPQDLNGKIDGFRLRFSRENQSIESMKLY